MDAPGVYTERGQNPPRRSYPTSIATGFMVGVTKKGSTRKAIECRNLNEFIRKAGTRLSGSLLYDTAETFFREGGSLLYIGRIISNTAVRAKFIIQIAGVTWATVYASSGGLWGNDLKFDIEGNADDNAIRLIVKSGSRSTVSPWLANAGELAAWSTEDDNDITVEPGTATGLPADATNRALTGGADNASGMTDADRTKSLNLFPKEMGPGMVAAPGITSDAMRTALGAHGVATKRVVIHDLYDTDDAEELLAQAEMARSVMDDESAKFSSCFAPWDKIPGVVKGLPRLVPPCGRIMGNLAYLINTGKTGNVAAAGDPRGVSRYAIGLTQSDWTATERAALNEAGVNVSRELVNGVTTMGWRTLAPIEDEDWNDLGNARLFMQIQALSDAIGQKYVFEEIDGERRVFGRLEGELKGMLLPFFTAGSLYGQTQSEAFVVDTTTPNTKDTIKAKEINSEIGLRMSEHGEVVKIVTSKTPNDEVLV